jgi:nitroimidazol reductase NimA-like FMN-containing flavoprotein (pyridoxamine 5'-phosphate oxidase superfamily)
LLELGLFASQCFWQSFENNACHRELMPADLKTERTKLRRRPNRAHYDPAAIAAILDQSFLCHVGFAVDGQPFVIPTSYGRDGDRLFIHGSAVSRMLRQIDRAVPVCVTVTLLDGLVLARSGFNHSMNYRSVVLLGNAEKVTGREKLRALEVISEHIISGRWAEVRPPNDKEMRATTVLAVAITEASAKIRTGPPLDDESDMSMTCWAGVLPLSVVAGAPVPDPRGDPNLPIPPYLMACDFGAKHGA